MAGYEERDTTGLLSGPNQTIGRGKDARGSSSGNATAKLVQLAFAAIVVIMVLISFVLSIVRTVTVQTGGLYIMLGLSLLGLVAIALYLLYFIRKGDLPQDKQWFLYFIGGCLVLEAIFTNILLYQ